jgi:hypothetical protein
MSPPVALDLTMRKIEKAFSKYQRLAASGLEPVGQAGFIRDRRQRAGTAAFLQARFAFGGLR